MIILQGFCQSFHISEGKLLVFRRKGRKKCQTLDFFRAHRRISIGRKEIGQGYPETVADFIEGGRVCLFNKVLIVEYVSPEALESW